MFEWAESDAILDGMLKTKTDLLRQNVHPCFKKAHGAAIRALNSIIEVALSRVDISELTEVLNIPADRWQFIQEFKKWK